MIKVLTIIGTRPEAIKVSILHKLLLEDQKYNPILVSTGQHEELLVDALKDFKLKADITLEAMRYNNSLAEQHSYLLSELQKVINNQTPDLIIVQGDTLSALCGAQVAFYNKIKLAHVEAGLRTGNKWGPFPEETNRVFIDRLADYHFCPSEQAVKNLKDEGLNEESIFLTGNTGIDALLHIKKRIEQGNPMVDLHLDNRINTLRSQSNKLILLTLHRREIHGEQYEEILKELEQVSKKENYAVIYPLHPHPALKKSIDKLSLDHIHIIPPLAYVDFIGLMVSSDLIITDSGGIQEEAPYLGVNTIVMRKETERSEILSSHNYTKSSNQNLSLDISTLLKESPKVITPYGNGSASQRILEILTKSLMPS